MKKCIVNTLLILVLCNFSIKTSAQTVDDAKDWIRRKFDTYRNRLMSFPNRDNITLIDDSIHFSTKDDPVTIDSLTYYNTYIYTFSLNDLSGVVNAGWKLDLTIFPSKLNCVHHVIWLSDKQNNRGKNKEDYINNWQNLEIHFANVETNFAQRLCDALNVISDYNNSKDKAF